MPVTSFLPKLSRRNSFYVTLALAFGVFSAVLVFELYASRQREYQNAEQNARNMAHVLEEHTRATIEKIDLVLNDVVTFFGMAAVNGNPQSMSINGGLRTLLARIPESQSLRIVDADGNFIYDATSKLGNVNVGDREYFLRNKHNPEAGLVISEPIFARLTNNRVITLSRRLEDRRGRFAGVVQAAVRAEFFQSFYQSLNVGSGGVVALYDTNLLLVARHPAVESQIGKPLKNGLVEKPLRDGAMEAVYSGKSTLDGVERLWDMRLVKGFPFLILVGLDHDDIYSQWYRKAFVYFLSAVVLALTLLVLARVWQRSYLRAINLAGEMTAAYEKSASQNRALLDSIPDMALLSPATEPWLSRWGEARGNSSGPNCRLFFLSRQRLSWMSGVRKS